MERDGFTNSTLSKQDFPSLLKRLMGYIEPKSKQNLISEFGTCGIYPLSLEDLMKKLPTSTSVYVEDVK